MIWARRGLALILLVQLALWLHQFFYFFTDAGPLPRVVVLRAVPASCQGISLHILSAQPLFQAVLFGLALGAAAAMLTRRWGQAACGVSWFLTLSALHRAPQASGSGTMLLCIYLFWLALLREQDDVRGRPVGWALLVQICLTAGLCAGLGPVPEELGWLGLVAPWLLWSRNRRLIGCGLALTAVFYVGALACGLGPLIGCVGLAALPAAWPAPAPVETRPAGRDLVAGCVLLLSLTATSWQLWRTPFPASARPLVLAFALQQAQELSNEPIPYYQARLSFSDGAWLGWDESDWLRRRHLSRLRANPVLARAYLNYCLRRSPRAGAEKLELWRNLAGQSVLEGSWTVQSIKKAGNTFDQL